VTGRRTQGPCRSCRAPMLWIRTRATGKSMPLDPEPNWERGNILLDEENKAVAFPSPEAAQQRRLLTGWDGPYISHFATCPNARRAA
jgi:hypothetical protein